MSIGLGCWCAMHPMPVLNNAKIIAAYLTIAFIAWSLSDGWLMSAFGIQQDNSRAEVDRILATSGLRQQELDIYKLLVDIGNDVEMLKQTDSYSGARAYRLEQLADIARKNYESMEIALAKLEDREPVTLRFDLPRPNPPTLLPPSN